MVSTRSTSAALGVPSPTSSFSSSPSRRTPKGAAATTTSIDIAIPVSQLPTTLSKARTTPRTTTTIKQSIWSHTPTPLTLLWLTVSLPLVAWDTGYVLLRPHSMPGGSLHWPLWTLYDLYGKVDHVYGFKAWDAGNGFTGAQGMMNLIETVLYGIYWGLWVKYGVYDGDRVEGTAGVLGKRRVGGRMGGLAVVVGFGAAVMTLSKTVLYWLNEYYSGFDNIGHNTVRDLIFLWIIPNGLWLVFPTYMIYVLGKEIVDGLAGNTIDPAAIKAE